jgi:hypothetical protein
MVKSAPGAIQRENSEMENLGELAEIVGPIGVLVVIAIWAIISRRQNGSSGRYKVVVAKLDGLREDIGEVKTDVRELRSSLVHHLEDHANS